MLSPCFVFAQSGVFPDAGALRQQLEPPSQVVLPPAQRPEPSVAPPPELQSAPGLQVTPSAFRFEGNRLLSDAQLALAVERFLGKPLGFDELLRAADAAAGAYRQAGWVVRVYLPQQDITEGVVTLRVVEARFGGVRFEGDVPARVSATDITAFATHRQPVGEPVQAQALERGLLIAGDLPGVSLSGALAPGDDAGETVLVLKTEERLMLRGDVGVDNLGARATGSSRLTANLFIDSPTGRGEQLTSNVIKTAGIEYLRAALTMPWGFDGRRLGLNVSNLNYRVVEALVGAGAIPLSGSSTAVGLDVSHPLVRERQRNLFATANLDVRQFVNRDSQVRADYDTTAIRLGFSGNLFDDWAGGGANSAGLQMQWGQLDNVQAHPQRETLDRSWHKLMYFASRQQNVLPGHVVLFSVSGQYAQQVLDSSERFYLGGPSSVRAYPVGEQAGDRGQLLTAEWRWRLEPQWLLTFFADSGRATQLAQPGSGRKSISLSGYGLSLGWQGPRGLNSQLVWSQRDGVNPQPTARGTDNDGTLRLNRLWLNLTLSF